MIVYLVYPVSKSYEIIYTHPSKLFSTKEGVKSFIKKEKEKYYYWTNNEKTFERCIEYITQTHHWDKKDDKNKLIKKEHFINTQEAYGLVLDIIIEKKLIKDKDQKNLWYLCKHRNWKLPKEPNIFEDWKVYKRVVI